MTATPLTEAETDRFLAPLARYGRTALAVSGGPDSVALLHLCVDFALRHGLAAPVALTVDHDLRPGSRAEAERVAEIAERLGAPHAILTWRHGPIDARLQARARAARYDLMAAYCTARDIPVLVTAHHLDDQAETFLMRLKRGSGLDGLAAIPKEGEWAGLTLLRPLLEASKAQLVATAEAAGLPLSNDPSNEDARFERVRLREAMAALAQIGLEPEAIALSARRLRRARSALEAAAGSFLDAHCERSPAGYASVSLSALLEAPEEVGLRALDRLVAAVGGSSEPLRLAKLEALVDGLRAEPDKAQTLGRCRIVPARGRVAVFREVRKAGLPRGALRPGERLLWDNRFRLELGAGEPEAVTVEALGEGGIEALLKDEEGALCLPRLAVCTLPVCRLGDGRLLLPDFGQGGAPLPAPLSRHEAGFDCRATFLWRTP
ncbi:tRNA lysidine(34) synthetase TilS [Methyloceanibacter caenitepidi]|uniref:tRNA lysidine(34) synthetase TilS n=1 Tax=Methyloceanibacter caenitepidi TaxID=1384459 RepID=UPI0006949679|nr:tRNA lysidine(34) synthetase TilS [Methyloceanibacter caenitepidi]